MKRTYLDSSVLIQAVQGVDGDKTAALLEDPEREFVAATFLKLELLPQPTFHKRKAELEFLAAYFQRVAESGQLGQQVRMRNEAVCHIRSISARVRAL